MNLRRFACLLLGAWLATSLAVALILYQNRRLIDYSLTHLSPAAAAHVKAIGQEQARMLFTFQVSEQISFYIEVWGSVQIVAGIGCLAFVLFATREGKATLALAVVVLLIVTLQRTLLVPEISSLIRLLQTDVGAAHRHRLITLKWVYYAVEGLKLAIGLAVASRLVAERRHRSRYAGQNVDVVDKSNYRHVNR